jgi:hypothetical protein
LDILLHFLEQFRGEKFVGFDVRHETFLEFGCLWVTSDLGASKVPTAL